MTVRTKLGNAPTHETGFPVSLLSLPRPFKSCDGKPSTAAEDGRGYCSCHWRASFLRCWRNFFDFLRMTNVWYCSVALSLSFVHVKTRVTCSSVRFFLFWLHLYDLPEDPGGLLGSLKCNMLAGVRGKWVDRIWSVWWRCKVVDRIRPELGIYLWPASRLPTNRLPRIHWMLWSRSSYHGETVTTQMRARCRGMRVGMVSLKTCN